MAAASTFLRIAAAVLVCWVLAVWASGAVYIVVSYIAGRRHVPSRPLVSTLGWALREMWYVMWTQPMLLWFQFFSARMGSGGGEVPVVLVHGYFQNRVDFLYLARWLRTGGSGPIYACNFFWPQSLERSSDDVRAFITRVLAETGAEKVDVVTHSSGGLFALDTIGDSPELVRRAVLVALPGRGVPWRGPVLGTSGSQLRQTSPYVARSHDRYRRHAGALDLLGARQRGSPGVDLGHHGHRCRQPRDRGPGPSRGAVRPPTSPKQRAGSCWPRSARARRAQPPSSSRIRRRASRRSDST